MEPKKSRFKLSYVFLILLVVLIVCFVFIDTGAKGEEINPTQVESLIDGTFKDEDDNIVQVAQIKYNKTEQKFYIIIKDSKYAKAFPDKADYHSVVTEEQANEIITDATKKNLYTGNFETQPSWFMAYLPTIMLLVFGGIMIMFLIKMMTKSNNSAMSFGKSKGRPALNSKVRFSHIAGADEEKVELEEIVEFLKNPAKFTALGARIPKGVLLVGPPGTGKTLLAKAVAGESQVPFISISGSDFVEMFVGVGASRVRDLFDQAKKMKPCIVFIDEIDAVGRQRGAGLGGGNDEREQTLNQLLVEMDGFEANEGIIVLAATNRSDVLDPALLRPGRFDRQIYVHVPDVKGREGILKIHAQGKPIDESVDFATLARITSGFTGADLENMLNESAILAARASRPNIIMSDITEGINKVLMGPQKKSRLIEEKERRLTAYHEAGHAILGRKLENCEEVQEVSIIPRGMAGGYTLSRRENDNSYLSYEKILDDICMSMGGRIAEEIVLKSITTGASSDIKHATKLAHKMIHDWGMSKKLGFISLDTDGQIFVGRDYQTKNGFSEKLLSEADDEVKTILANCYDKAKKILLKEIDLLHEMTQLLLVRETIYKEEIDMLEDGKKKEEIVELMQEKEKIQKEKEERIVAENKKRQDLENFEKKIKDGEQLLKAGIINQEEFDEVVANFNKFKEKNKSCDKIINDEKIQQEVLAEEENNVNKSEQNEEKSVNDKVDNQEEKNSLNQENNDKKEAKDDENN